jgi:two-component system response regulator AtoC
MLVAKAAKERKLIHEVRHHRNRSLQKTRLDDIIGKSAVMRELFGKVRRLRRVDVTTVLILGESGTGKNQLAKAIHNQSNRKDQPFIEINCATLPEQLLESELFGHERGAFTDAKSAKVGLVELADGGTLFLDEIGEMPMPLQAKLLKFIETKTFRRIGGVTETNTDIFIIASTNRDLERCVAEKTFRADLYYRMAVVPLTMPPLRDRTGDVDRLVSHYWQVFTHKFHKPDLYLQPEVRSLLAVYDWPGNIRELRNLLEQLIILSGKHGVWLGDLPNRFHQPKSGRRDGLTIPSEDAVHHAESADRPLADAVDALEIKEITRALEDCQGVKAKAAKQLGISRYALLRKIKRYRLA